jgi:hypothetical protein
MEPVQSGFTTYVPTQVTLRTLPFATNVAVASVLPSPSKDCLPISPKGRPRAPGEREEFLCW